MNKSLSKREIWRNSVSPFARFMFGVRVFFCYLGFLFSCLDVLVSVGLINIGLDAYMRNMLNSVASKEGAPMFSMTEMNSVIAISKSFVVVFYLIVLALSLAMILWYHIGKSRFLATCNFIGSILGFLFLLIALCFLYADTLICTIILLVTILFTVADFVIMRGTYQYHRALANARFKQEDQIRRAAEKARRNEQFQITKPTLEHVYYPMKDSQKADANTIKIDQYLNDKSVERGSIYRDMSSSGEDSSGGKTQNLEKKEQKDQKPAVRVVKEQPIDLSDNPGAGSKYDFEKRPLLSEIKENGKKSGKDEPIEVSQIDETDSSVEKKIPETPVEKESDLEEISESSEEEKEPVLEEIPVSLEEEKESVLEEIPVLEENLYEEMDVQEKHEITFDMNIQDGSEEVVHDANDLELKMDDKTATDTEVVENYEEGENGIRVDTSLGYRRITFDDI